MHMLLRIKPNQNKVLWNRKSFTQISFSHLFYSSVFSKRGLVTLWGIRVPKPVMLNPRLRWLILQFFLELESTWTVSLKSLLNPHRTQEPQTSLVQNSSVTKDRHPLAGTCLIQNCHMSFSFLKYYFLVNAAWLFYGHETKVWTILGVNQNDFSCSWTQNWAGCLCAALPRVHGQEPGMLDVWCHSLKTLQITGHTAAVPECPHCSRLHRGTQEDTLFALKTLPVSIWQDTMNRQQMVKEWRTIKAAVIWSDS